MAMLVCRILGIGELNRLQICSYLVTIITMGETIKMKGVEWEGKLFSMSVKDRGTDLHTLYGRLALGNRPELRLHGLESADAEGINVTNEVPVNAINITNVGGGICIIGLCTVQDESKYFDYKT